MRSQGLHVLICDSDPETLIDLERMLEDELFGFKPELGSGSASGFE
jgi:hypothetical protein